MTHDEMLAVLEDYVELQTNNWYKPSWFDCLTFLSGYCGHISPDMVMAVRKLQREGRVE